MNPLLFGSRERQLFGIHAPAAGRRERRGVVICPPWGQEYLRSYRSCRLLEDRLAQNGQDVLRFDYYGTGDSAGEGEDVTLRGCVEDASMAVEEIEALAGVRKVTMVGLRLGAAVASAAAAGHRSVDRLVLWDPVSDGAGYVEEMMSEAEDGGGGGVAEVAGFPLTPGLREEMRDVAPERLVPTLREVLLIVSEESDEHETLKGLLGGSAAAVDFEVRPNPRCWVEEQDFGLGAVPADILERIAAW